MPSGFHNIDSCREQLLNHGLFCRIDRVSRLRVFMESHAFAVWDFMSLLKRLQADLCPARVPWRPPADVASARFINEIVLGEESDLDEQGQAAGHLDIYLTAMDEVGADTSGFRMFLSLLAMGRRVPEALNRIRARTPVRQFVQTTLDIALKGQTHEVAAAFLFGREDPIPAMFSTLLERLSAEGLEASRLAYYLKRHIELDGDSHGPMGRRLLERLIDGDSQRSREAELAGTRAIEARIAFWTGIEDEVIHGTELDKFARGSGGSGCI